MGNMNLEAISTLSAHPDLGLGLGGCLGGCEFMGSQGDSAPSLQLVGELTLFLLFVAETRGLFNSFI
jgi:hypothetical protein